MMRSRFRLFGVNHEVRRALKSLSIADKDPTRDVADALYGVDEEGVATTAASRCFSAWMQATQVLSISVSV